MNYHVAITANGGETAGAGGTGYDIDGNSALPTSTPLVTSYHPQRETRICHGE